jgi:CheY-like chemotaxis protein
VDDKIPLVSPTTRSSQARTRQPSRSARLEKPEPPKAASARPAILVVDDELAIRRALTDILTSQGYPVRSAQNGQEALQIVAQSEPALVLLDMRMPVMDGWTFARVLRERGLKTPLVVMAPTENAVKWCFEVGGVEPLGKPFDLRQLLDTVERVYRRALLRR